jgi:hypothetical protein
MSDCHEIGGEYPLTPPTPAGENARAVHPLPHGGEGGLAIFMPSGEPEAHGICAQDDRGQRLVEINKLAQSAILQF